MMAYCNPYIIGLYFVSYYIQLKKNTGPFFIAQKWSTKKQAPELEGYDEG